MKTPKTRSDDRPSSDWISDPWMHELFDAVFADAGEPDYGPGAWFRWMAEGAPAASLPEWLKSHLDHQPNE